MHLFGAIIKQLPSSPSHQPSDTYTQPATLTQKHTTRTTTTTTTNKNLYKQIFATKYALSPDVVE